MDVAEAGNPGSDVAVEPAPVMVAVPAPVMSSTFCVPHEAQFVIKRDDFFTDAVSINDADGTFRFEVKILTSFFNPTKKLVLRDATGRILLTFKKNFWLNCSDYWEAYLGDDERENNLLFTMERSFSWNPFSFKSYEVVLASNVDPRRPDFTLKWDFWQRKYVILHSGTEPFAQATMRSTLLGMDQYAVTACPGADHAFIAAVLAMIVSSTSYYNKIQKECWEEIDGKMLEFVFKSVKGLGKLMYFTTDNLWKLLSEVKWEWDVDSVFDSVWDEASVFESVWDEDSDKSK